MNGCYQVSCSESQEKKQQKRLPIWSGLVPRIQPSCPEGPGILSLVTRRCCLVKRVAYGIVGCVLSCFVRSLPTKCNGTWRRCVRSLVCIPRQISVLLIQFKILNAWRRAMWTIRRSCVTEVFVSMFVLAYYIYLKSKCSSYFLVLLISSTIYYSCTIICFFVDAKCLPLY